MGWVTVNHVKNPFRPVETREVTKVHHDGDLHALIQTFWPHQTEHLEVAVSLNGVVLPEKADLKKVALREGDCVTFCAIPRGGGGGKNPLRTVLMLAVVVAAAVVSSGGGLVIGGTTLSGTIVTGAGITYTSATVGALTISGTVLAAGIMIGGGILINAFFPVKPPNTKIPNASRSTHENSQTYGWDTGPNREKLGEALPILFGKHRITPAIIGKYTRTAGDKQYLYMLYALTGHYIDSIDSIRINKQPSTNYQDISTQKRYGENVQAVTEYFNDTRVDMIVDATLSTTYTTRITQEECDYFGIGLSFPQGIWYVNDTGGLSEVTIQVSGRYRKVGDSTWTDLYGGVKSLTRATTSAVRDFHLVTNPVGGYGQYEIEIKFHVDPPTGSRYGTQGFFEYIQQCWRDDLTYPNTSILALEALATNNLSGGMPRVDLVVERNFLDLPLTIDTIPPYNIIKDATDLTSTSWVKSAHTQVENVAYKSPFGDFTSSVIKDVSSGSWENGLVSQTFPISSGDNRPICASVFFAPKTTTACRLQLFEVVGGNVVQDVQININPTNWSILSSQGDVSLESARPDSWRRAVCKATLSGTATGAANDFIQVIVWSDVTASGTGEVYATGVQLEFAANVSRFCPSDHIRVPANNPAWAAVYLLTDKLNGGSVNPSQIIGHKFAAWANYCTAKNLKLNYYIDDQISLKNALSTISTIGRGTVLQMGSQFTCIFTDVNAIPTNRFMFTMGNIEEDSFQEEWLATDQRTNIIEISYWDEERDWEQETFTLYDLNYDALTTVPYQQSIALYGCTSREQAARHARVLLNQNRYLTLTCSWSTDIEALHCIPGDIVDVAHDKPNWGHTFFIIAATENSVTVNRQENLPESHIHTISVKHMLTDNREARDVTSHILNPDGTMTVNFALPFTEDLIPGQSCVISNVDRRIRMFQILEITRDGDYKRNIKALEFIPEALDDTTLVPSIDIPSVPATVHTLVASIIQTREDALTKKIISLTWRGRAIGWYVMRRRIGDPENIWVQLGFTTEPNFLAYNTPVGHYYEFVVSPTVVPADGKAITVHFTADSPLGTLQIVQEYVDGVLENVVEYVGGVLENVEEIV